MIIQEKEVGIVVITLGGDEVEPFKDLVTSFLDVYPQYCDGVAGVAEERSRQQLLDAYDKAMDNGGEDPESKLEESEIRDALCWQAMEKVGTAIIGELGEGGTSYALDPIYDNLFAEES